MANSSSGGRLQGIVAVLGLLLFMAAVYITVSLGHESSTGTNTPNGANHGPNLPGTRPGIESTQRLPATGANGAS
jgi:hypothetical protein